MYYLPFRDHITMIHSGIIVVTCLREAEATRYLGVPRISSLLARDGSHSSYKIARHYNSYEFDFVSTRVLEKENHEAKYTW
jgi:hypothetical protein